MQILKGQLTSQLHPIKIVANNTNCKSKAQILLRVKNVKEKLRNFRLFQCLTMKENVIPCTMKKKASFYFE